LDALEEWISEDNEKYLGSKKLVDSWEDVASIVGSENAEGLLNILLLNFVLVNLLFILIYFFKM